MMAKAKTETAKVMVLPRPGKARRTSAQAWIERTNPLTRLSLRAAQNVYDTARGGGYTRLQYIYSEIEKTDPTLFTCVDRRLSALSALGWRVVANEEGLAADAQKAKLEKLLDGAVGLSAAIEHLGLAFFRGFSFAAPYMEDGRLAFSLPPSWEFNRSPDGTWWHNPLVIETGPGGQGQTQFDPDDVLHIERARAVDYPALALFLRHEVAEDQWGRFLERYGIPPVILEMPPLTQPGDADRFAQAAQQVYEALCGAVPNGTKVNTLAEARGADPFSAFIEHQEKTMVRLCTGGTLGSIAEATGIGSGASDAQGDVWREIVARDAVLIGEEFTRWLGRFVFPEGMLVRFELGTERRATPEETFETAAKARQAGYRFTKEYLETETGAELEEDTSSPGGSGGPDGGFGPVAAGRFSLRNKQPATPLQTPKASSINAPEKPPRDPSDADGAPSAVLKALAKDTGAAAEAIAELLENPTPERAAALAKRLPELAPEDPALAAVIAEEMAKAYGDAFTQAQSVAANKKDANGAEHAEAGSGNGGQFVSKGEGGGADGSPSEKKEQPEHTPEEQKRIEEFNASIDQTVVGTTNEIVDIFENDKPRDRVSKMHANFGTVSDQSAQRISARLGYDVSGYDIFYDGSDILHTWERHGRNGEADQSMADVANFGRAGYVVNHADTIEPLTNADGTPDLGNFLDKSGKKSPKLMARMRIDGTAATTIVAPDSKKRRIHIISMRIEKSAGGRQASGESAATHARDGLHRTQE